jgi:hypothetical protein
MMDDLVDFQNQRKILEMMAEGISTVEIAQSLRLKYSDVRNVRASLLKQNSVATVLDLRIKIKGPSAQNFQLSSAEKFSRKVKSES